MAETARPDSSASFVDLQITDKIFPLVMQTIKDGDLSDKESRYLSYLYGVCGGKGCTFRLQKTIASELSKMDYSIRRVERSLQQKGRLCIFEYQGRTYRSPYPELVKDFLSSQEAPAERGADEQNYQVAPEKNVHEPTIAEAQKPAPEAYQQTCQQPPIRLYNFKSLQQPVQAELTNKQSYHMPTNTPVDNRTEKKNPHNKNRHIVRHITDDICETLGIWQSWKWVAKQVWSISDSAEEHLIHCAKWVREEIHCNRCTNAFGLFRWKLTQEGLVNCQ